MISREVRKAFIDEENASISPSWQLAMTSPRQQPLQPARERLSGYERRVDQGLWSVKKLIDVDTPLSGYEIRR